MYDVVYGWVGGWLAFQWGAREGVTTWLYVLKLVGHSGSAREAV